MKPTTRRLIQGAKEVKTFPRAHNLTRELATRGSKLRKSTASFLKSRSKPARKKWALGLPVGR